MLFKDLAGTDPYLGGKDHEDWEFEDNAECQDEDGDKVYKPADGDHRFELGGLEAEEEFDAIGKGDEITEAGTKIKKDGGEENKPGKG